MAEDVHHGRAEEFVLNCAAEAVPGDCRFGHFGDMGGGTSVENNTLNRVDGFFFLIAGARLLLE